MLDLYEINKEPPIIGFDYDPSGLSNCYNRELTSDPSEIGYGHEHQSLRRLFYAENKGFRDFYNSISESIPSIIKTFIDMDQAQNKMPKRWPTNKIHSIAERIKLEVFPIIDMPGFSLGSHIDQRSWFATGLINVTDNHPVTVFTRKKQGSFFNRPFYKVEGQAGKGVLWLNTESTWHHMERVPHERKIIQINFVLV